MKFRFEVLVSLKEGLLDPQGKAVQDALAKKGAKARRTGPVNILSDRELQVLRLVARGYSSRQIAKQILVGVKTVETYRSRLAQKLGLRTRSDVVRFAVQMGLLAPEMLEIEEGRPARQALFGRSEDHDEN